MADVDRDHERGRDRAARRAAGGLRAAGQRVRRRLHRRAGDELPALRRRHGAGRRRDPDRRGGRARAGAARGGLGAPAAVRRAARACALRGRLGAARRSARHRIPRHSTVVTLATAEGATLRAKVEVDKPARRGDHVGLAFDAAAVSLFDRASGRALRTARDDQPARRAPGSPPWLSFASPASASASARCRRSTASTRHRQRRVLRAARPERRRQDDDAAPRRRPRDARRRQRLHRRRDVTALAPALRDVAFVFQQYSLYPHLSVYDNLAFPLRSPLRRTPEAEVRSAWRRSRACCASTTSSRARRRGSRAARCSAWRSAARWCASPALPDGRAAVLARRQAAQRPAPRAQAHPAGPGRDHALRHARPDRGDDAGHPHRRARRGPAGAGRHAARSTRTRAARTSRRGWARRASTWSRGRCCPAWPARRARSRSACAPSTCACTAARPAARTARRGCGASSA